MAELAVGTEENGYRFVGGDPASPTSWEPAGLKIGTEDSGFRFRGGDPSDEASWEPVPAKKGVLDRIGTELGQLRDEAFSGIEQAVSAVKNVNAAGQAKRLQSTQEQIRELERRGRGDSIAARQLRGEVASLQERLPTTIGTAAEANATAQRGSEMVTRPAVQKVAAAKTLGEAWDAFKEAPYDVIAGVTAQSLPQTLPALIVGAMAGPAAGAAGMGLSSGAVEFGSSLTDFAREQGVNTGDAKALEAFYSDPQKLQEGLAYAGKRAGIIGTLDAASGGIAGKTIAPAIKRPLARQAVNVPAQMGVQAAAGAAGEAGAQLATKGEVAAPGQVLLEAAGELGGAPAEVVAFSREARAALRPQPKPEDILKAPDVDTAIQTAQEVLALPPPSANSGDTILTTSSGEAGTTAQIDAMRRQREIREGGNAGLGRNSDIVDVDPKPAPGPIVNDASALLERQAAGDVLPSMLEARRMRTEAADAAQAEAAQRREAELAAIPELAAKQNTVQEALQRAGAVEAPTAMQLAMQRARAIPAAAEAAGAPAAPTQPAPVLPRIVERTPEMVALPQKLAEQRVAATGGEVVRIRNKSGKFAFTVIPRTADATQPTSSAASPAPDRAAATPSAPAEPAAGRAGSVGPAPGGAAVAPPAAVGEPAATWFGRRGDGYLTQADAALAVRTRERNNPDLRWVVEQMPSGKFRLAGYTQEQRPTVTATAVPRLQSDEATRAPDETAPPQTARQEAITQDPAPEAGSSPGRVPSTAEAGTEGGQSASADGRNRDDRVPQAGLAAGDLAAQRTDQAADADSAQARGTQQPAKPLDHGELNVPGRTSRIDADLDRFKAEQAKAKKAEAKQISAQRQSDKTRAKDLFVKHWPAMKERMGARFGEKALRDMLDSMVKWEPAKFIAMVEKFQKEQAERENDSAQARDTAQRRSDERMPSGLTMEEARRAIRRMRGPRAGDVQKIVNDLTAGWKNGPRIHVVQTADDLPGENPSNTRGLYERGEIWIVAGSLEHGTRAGIARTLAHEAVAHWGLRNMLGREAWTKLMNTIQLGIKAGNKQLREIQAYVRETYVDAEGNLYLNEAQEADEIAAMAVEDAIDDDGNFKPGFGFLKSVWAQVAQFLRDLGIKVAFSNAQLQGMLVLSMRNMEAGRRTAGGGQLAVAAAREDGRLNALDGEVADDTQATGAPEEDAFEGTQQARSTITGIALPKTWQAPDESKLDDLIYTLQDKHVDTKRAVQAVRDSIGAIADEQDPYLQEELFHGRAAKSTKDFLDKELRPLLVDMQARGVELSDFEEYLHNRHAERRNVQVAKVNAGMSDGGSGIKTKDARAYLAGLPAGTRRTYEMLAKRVDAITKATRQLLVDSGLEKQETIDAWDAAYGDEYVPLMREEMDDGRAGLGQGYSVRGSASKRAMGSDKPVADIIANIAMQRERTITRAQKRRIGEALYGLVLKAPNDDFWIAVDPALQQDPKQVMQTQLQLITMGLDPADAESIAKEPTQRYVDPRTKQVAERINPALRSADNVLAVRVNGDDKFVFFNARDPRAMRMVTALKNLDADQLGTAMGYVAKMTRWFASVNTQFNPIFGITNLTRDVQGALLNLTSTPLAAHKAEVANHVLPALRGIYIDLRDHRAGKTPTSSWAQLFEEFQREGGATGYRDMYANAAERADGIVSELRSIKSGRAFKLAKGVFDWLSDYNESMENAVRVSAYKVGVEQGLTKQQAASLAKNLTVNFNRKGQVALQAGALYAFFNASAQGTARLAQTLFKDGKLSAAGQKIIAGGLLLGVMQALLLAAVGFDEDEPPDFVRERSLVIPISGTKYIAIPMPLGYHVIPNLGRIPTEWAMSGFKNTTKRIAQLVGVFVDAFNPIGNAGLSLQTIAPTVIDPLAALAENKDWTGKPIAKKDFDANRPTAGHTRAKDTATPWAKMISYGVNIATGGTDYKPGLASPTPDQIDYLIGQVTGGVGREVSKLAQSASGAMSGEDVPLHKIPLVGRFVGTTEGQAAEAARYYDNLREIGSHKVQIDGLRKDGRGAEISAYVRENSAATLVPMATAIQREVTELQHRKRDLIKKDAPPERVKLVDQQITSRMKLLNDRARKLEKAAVAP
jgi:hypothetical protein